MEPILEELDIEGYHKVVKVTEPSCGLVAIISIHDLTMGPSLGGIRFYPYENFDAALFDAMRLSKGMTYKSAMVDFGCGGGKSVIIADPKTQKTPELLRAFGKAINMLGGIYIGAEDSGCTPEDLAIMNEETPFLVGLMHEKSSGHPSPYTAWGTFRGIEAALKFRFGSTEIAGKHFAFQGVGSVGEIIAEHLFWRGAKLTFADVNVENCARLAKKFGAKVVSTDEIVTQECDVFVPCALGGVIHKENIPHLKCQIIAGCANNVLLEESDGDLLRERNILYAPDFVINGGGLINVVCEIVKEGYCPIATRNSTDKIYESLLSIFQEAEKTGCSTVKAAITLAKYRLQHEIGKRPYEPCFHHSSNKVTS